MKICTVSGSQVVPCRRTDRWTDITKLIFTFATLETCLKRLQLYLCLSKDHTTNNYEGWEVHLHRYLASSADGGKPSALYPGCFMLEGITHWLQSGWADFAVEKRKD
jgi:hypothetical protein